MIGLLLTLLACDPNEEVKVAEVPYYSAAGIAAATRVELAPIEDGQPLGELGMRLEITDRGMRIDNRAWFLRLDHGAVRELRGEGRVKNLVYEEEVDIHLDDGVVAEGDLEHEEIRELGRYLARMQQRRTKLPRTLDPSRELQIYADADIPAMTLNRAMLTARRAGFDPITVVGARGDTPRAAIVDRPEPWTGWPCATEVQLAKRDGGWAVMGLATPALTTGDGCAVPTDEVPDLLSGIADRCRTRWQRWQADVDSEAPNALDTRAWQCIGARPRWQDGATVGDVLELYGKGYGRFPDVVMMEHGGRPPIVDISCDHAVRADSLDDQQLDVLCGIDWVPQRLAVMGHTEATPASLLRVAPGRGLNSHKAFPAYNRAMDEFSLKQRVEQLQQTKAQKSEDNP